MRKNLNTWHNELVGYFYNSFNDSLLLLLHRLAPNNPISMGVHFYTWLGVQL